MNFDIRKLRRHRHFKMGISLGLVSTSLMAMLLPHLVHETILLNTLTNMLWVWEDSLE